MDSCSLHFGQALASFDAGEQCADALLDALDADLAAGFGAATLADLLDRYEVAKPLPTQVYRTLVARLRRLDATFAQEDETVDLDAPLGSKPVDLLRGLDVTGPPLAGRYQLLELVGRGGTSLVYKAVDVQELGFAHIQGFVALKLIALQAMRPDSVEAFEEHLQRIKNLVHPTIVRPLDWGALPELYYVASEYVTGPTLYEHMRLHPRRSANLKTVCQIADGLRAAHAQSIVHGDLKPGNILITDSGEVRIIDFGFEGLPRRPAVTSRYSSPQRMQRLAPQQTDDVFAFACIAFELLMGEPPLAASAAHGGMSPTHSGRLSEVQCAAFKHALEPDASRRTQSAQEFVQELLRPASRRTVGRKWLPVSICAFIGVALGFLCNRALHPPRPSAIPPAALSVARPPAFRRREPGDVIRDCATCTALRIIPAGSFVRGSSPGDKGASRFSKPRQVITIPAPLAVAIDPITVGEFEAFVADSGRVVKGCEVYDGKWHFDPGASWQNPGFPQTAHHPVTCVSWEDADAYAAWLSQKTRHHYRLPTGAEWEYAARAGAPTVVAWDSPADACRVANVADRSASRRYPRFKIFDCDDDYVYTAPVGRFVPNPFGLRDMLGNVFAWTLDCWTDSIEDAPLDGSARSSINCPERELRGGSWFSSPDVVRASYRSRFAGNHRASSFGIRLVRELTPDD